MIPRELKSILKSVRARLVPLSRTSPRSYWTRHNVTLHERFQTAKASLDYFHWRNAQYHGYLELMPVAGQDGKAVLDYGCGPGHDLVGFGVYSRPRRLIGVDISPISLMEAEHRIGLHGVSAELVRVDEGSVIPLDTGSIDYVHCSGVLHHARDPGSILREFRRLLSQNGTARVMVYNYDSVWLHLYVAFTKQIQEGQYRGLDVSAAFAKTTDGPDCPIAEVYKPEEFVNLATDAGFSVEFTGAAVAMWEMNLLPRRFEAVMSRELPDEHRQFLLSLTFDEKGYPKYRGYHAGVDACYLLRTG